MFYISKGNEHVNMFPDMREDRLLVKCLENDMSLRGYTKSAMSLSKAKGK